MKKKIVLLTQLIGLLSILWMCYFLTSLFFNHNQKQIHFFPPKSARLSVCLNGEDLVNKAAFTALIESKDNELSNQLRIILESNRSDNSKDRKFLGIDLFTSFHFFTDEFNGQELSGYIFNLDNTDLWDLHSGSFFGIKSYSQRIENTGLILTSSTLTKKNLQKYYKNTTFNKDYEAIHKSEFSMQLRYACTNSIEKTIQKLNSNITVESKSIISEGTIILGKNIEITQLTHSLSPKYFHIDSRIIPKDWNDTLREWAKRYVVEIPSIKALSLNYGGLEIQSTQNGVLPLPNMELILEFKKEFSIQNFINKTENRGDVDIHLKSNYFKIGPKIYYLQQLTPTTIYIGTTKEPVIQTKRINSVIAFEGSPHYLTEVKGSRFMMTLLNMNDAFSQLKEFCGDVQSIKGTLILKGNEPLRYNTTIQFKKSENAMNQLLKILLINAQKN